MKKKLFVLLGVMIIITIIGSLAIQMFSPDHNADSTIEQEKLQVVTTFYPVYLIGLNLAGQSEDMEVNSLTDLSTGCLHDYQLTTEDMKLISNADVLVINGGGMEGFLEDVMKNYPELTIIDASEGIVMLKEEEEEGLVEGESTEESTEEESTEESTEELAEQQLVEGKSTEKLTEDKLVTEESGEEEHIEEEEGHDEHDHGEFNAHVWLDPQLYLIQITNVRDGLIEFLDSNKIDSSVSRSVLKNEITQNAEVYLTEVEKLDQEMEAVFQELSADNVNGSKAVIFHDSFAYLAERAGIQIAYTVPLESDTALSAGEIATIINAVKQDNIQFLFTEAQFSDSIARQIEEETEAKGYIIDSVVTGEGKPDSYLEAMRNNLEVIKSALK